MKNNGAKVLKAGLMPTPAISYLTKKLNCNIGIVVSASHNPYQFNGIKFFNKKGEKLSALDEDKIDEQAVCIEIYQPVCGCNAKTYSNTCYAKRAGLISWKDGECI